MPQFAQLALARALIGAPLQHWLIGAEATRDLDGRAAVSRQEIDATMARVETLIEQMDARIYEPILHETRVRVAQLSGDHPTYARELTRAQHRWEVIGATRRATALSAELAPLTA